MRTLWKRTLAKKDFCEKGSLWKRTLVKKDPCEKGPLWKRTPVKKDPRKKGPLWKRTPVKKDPCVRTAFMRLFCLIKAMFVRNKAGAWIFYILHSCGYFCCKGGISRTTRHQWRLFLLFSWIAQIHIALFIRCSLNYRRWGCKEWMPAGRRVSDKATGKSSFYGSSKVP